MADFNHKKLQVFVSSTYTDLRNERQAAVESILTAGHIPAGMELFTAGDESQMEVIKQWIDESDVYMLILGGRYGSIDTKSGKSYTHLEYDYALTKEKPLFACVINEAALDKKARAEGKDVIEQECSKEFKEFKKQVLGKMCKFWDDSKDIKIAVAEALSGITRRDGLKGWVRAESQSDLPALANEIARLSKENAILREQSSNQEERILGLTFGELGQVLEHAGVYEFLVENRKDLGVGELTLQTSKESERIQIRQAEELCVFGLVSKLDVYNHDIGTQYTYGLTDSGRGFLNKLIIHEVRSIDNPLESE